MAARHAQLSEEALLQELEALAGRLGIQIHYESLEGRGGLCRYRGKFHLILSGTLSSRERIRVCAGPRCLLSG